MIDFNLFGKIDPETPLRLSPKAFIHRDDENYFIIALYDKVQARKYLNHLLTAVYSFIDYSLPGDLIAMWPPDTVNDLLNVIITLKKEQILLTEQEYNAIMEESSVERTAEEKEYNDDKVWQEKFSQALLNKVNGRNVLLLESKGAGYLAIESAKNSANMSVATISDYVNARLANDKAKNACLSNVRCIFSNNHKICPVSFADKFDILVTELFDSTILEKKVLESVLYAKKHLLTPDALFIPAKLTLKIFAFETNIHRDLVQESREFETLYGLKFESFRNALQSYILDVDSVLYVDSTKKLSEDMVIKEFDFAKFDRADFSETIEVKITEPGKICGYCVYFDLELTPDLHITNSPFDSKIRYKQRLFTPAGSVYGNPGDVIKLNISYDTKLRVKYDA